jgi:hypothetical protein
MFRDLKQKIKPLFYELPGQIYSREKVRRRGTVRDKERMGLLPKPSYAYGLFRAADVARFLGKRRVTVCEFGVATGNGLLALINLAALISCETGVEFRIVGFDTGEGLPQICSYPDHPELWSAGDFPMVDRAALVKRVDGRAELLFGDIKDTVGGFIASLSPEVPLGFVSVDVDIYTASHASLRCFEGGPELYLPAISMYFDDVSSFFSNRWCGELRAIEEFNQVGEFRKIDRDRTMINRAVNKSYIWHEHMYVCHVLDHESRTRPKARQGLTLKEHADVLREFHLI